MNIDRKALVGLWQLRAWVYEFQDSGERKAMFGEHPRGFLVFTPEGRVMALAEGEGRQPPQSDPARVAAFQSMVAYSGLDRIEGDQWIVDVDVAWNPAYRGVKGARQLRLEGDLLHILTAWEPNLNFGGRVARGVLTWQRVTPAPAPG
jgi:hypothetical protein